MTFLSRFSRRSQMTAAIVVLAAVGLAGWTGCHSTPVTGRRQLLVVPEKQEVAMGVSAYDEILAKEKLSTNQQYIDMVNRVGQRIAAVADRPDYDWEFNVIASEQQNAFALPGGKVAIHEGILPICQNEAGLAVVMSHEIAHALARHGGERMSHAALQNGLQKGVQFATRQRSKSEQKVILSAYGVASQYGVMLPYSRKQESEADHIGLLLMAKAGYEPEEAPRFWERFAGAKGGDSPAEFLSTHPADQRRADDLRALLPKAMQEYSKADTRHGIGEYLAR